jgi:hypothetical protein
VTAPSGLHLRGSHIAVTAKGLDAAEPYTVKVGATVVATGVASSTGTVKRSVTIPSHSSEARHTVRVTGSIPTRTGSDTVYVVSTSKSLSASLAPKSSVQAGRTFTITVRHLAPREKVTVRYDGHRVSATSAAASASGVYTVRVKAGARWGTKRVTVVGMTGSRTITKSITVVPRR